MGALSPSLGVRHIIAYPTARSRLQKKIRPVEALLILVRKTPWLGGTCIAALPAPPPKQTKPAPLPEPARRVHPRQRKRGRQGVTGSRASHLPPAMPGHFLFYMKRPELQGRAAASTSWTSHQPQARVWQPILPTNKPLSLTEGSSTNQEAGLGVGGASWDGTLRGVSVLQGRKLPLDFGASLLQSAPPVRRWHFVCSILSKFRPVMPCNPL
jgi:hypothetical protein